MWRLQDFFYACLFLSLDIAVSLLATLGLIFACSRLLGFVTLATVVPTIALIIFYASKLQPTNISRTKVQLNAWAHN